MLKFFNKSRLIKLESFLEDTIPIANSKFKNIGEYYQAICKRHNIINAPKIVVKKDFPFSGAVTEYNTIVLGVPNLDMLSDTEKRAVVMHELGHILRGDMGSSKRAYEYAADRLSIALLGRKSPIISVINKTHKVFEQEMIELKNSEHPIFRIISYILKSRMEKTYGTHAERIANIERSSINIQKTNLQKLLEKRRNTQDIQR
ncbi:MAG: hypothetical protein R3D71_10385 [Rickettsiales bacterium]